MISIVNLGPKGSSNPNGVREYEIRINRKPITRFFHRRGDGLARCLLEASKAVERQVKEDSDKFIKMLDAEIQERRGETDT